MCDLSLSCFVLYVYDFYNSVRYFLPTPAPLCFRLTWNKVGLCAHGITGAAWSGESLELMMMMLFRCTGNVLLVFPSKASLSSSSHSPHSHHISFSTSSHHFFVSPPLYHHSHPLLTSMSSQSQVARQGRDKQLYDNGARLVSLLFAVAGSLPFSKVSSDFSTSHDQHHLLLS